MPLEKYYLGDDAFSRFSESFADPWEVCPIKDQILAEVGGVELARPIYFHLGKHYLDWLDAKVPALDDLTPRECLKTKDGIKRLKTCLQRMPC